MHPEILSHSQTALLPLLQTFDGQFGMVGGTALALQLGHRQSIDFDLFTSTPLQHSSILQTIQAYFPVDRVIIDSKNELTLVTNQVKVTFYQYPFKLDFNPFLSPYIHLADALTIGAMKAYALGRRAKWKDYVDLYHIFHDYSFNQVVNQAKRLFSSLFDEKQFREQLAYHQDIDFSETVIYTPNHQVDDQAIKLFLQHQSLE